jgi:hypothetical protein
MQPASTGSGFPRHHCQLSEGPFAMNQNKLTENIVIPIKIEVGKL